MYIGRRSKNRWSNGNLRQVIWISRMGPKQQSVFRFENILPREIWLWTSMKKWLTRQWPNKTTECGLTTTGAATSHTPHWVCLLNSQHFLWKIPSSTHPEPPVCEPTSPQWLENRCLDWIENQNLSQNLGACWSIKFKVWKPVWRRKQSWPTKSSLNCPLPALWLLHFSGCHLLESLSKVSAGQSFLEMLPVWVAFLEALISALPTVWFLVRNVPRVKQQGVPGRRVCGASPRVGRECVSVPVHRPSHPLPAALMELSLRLGSTWSPSFGVNSSLIPIPVGIRSPTLHPGRTTRSWAVFLGLTLWGV